MNKPTLQLKTSKNAPNDFEIPSLIRHEKYQRMKGEKSIFGTV